ncbi:54S ribosomal protein L38, mitochondrial [Trichoderma asperellum]|uniref:Large ribosomal subunit protein uL14m n=8 Tax=Trichoderma TaxID=5543 RepID=A0A6V8QHL0_TRIAP|nr:54S ribosomal protein L38, mitochondrial [Trichoderma asperellum]
MRGQQPPPRINRDSAQKLNPAKLAVRATDGEKWAVLATAPVFPILPFPFPDKPESRRKAQIQPVSRNFGETIQPGISQLEKPSNTFPRTKHVTSKSLNSNPKFPCGAVTMIQLKTMLNCIDNSGAALVECALVVGQKRHARIGDRIVVVVQEQRGSSSSGMAGISAAAKVKRGDIRHAVVVRTRYPTQRRDGTVVRFDDNACVLLNKSGDPVGTRINGVVGAELKRKKWSKILSMAPMQA